MEKVRNGKRVTSFARDGVEWIRVARESPSEQPFRETIWALGAGVGGAVLLNGGVNPFKTGEFVAGSVFCLVAVVLVVNLFRRVPLLTIRRDGALVRVRFEGEVTADELDELGRRLREELGWPLNT